ncbi:hypothetical protein OHR68_06480 [Spirillospora sp. NBC_00431]
MSELAALALDLDSSRCRLVESGSALALKPNTLNEAGIEYRRFLMLCRASPELAMPSDLVLAEMMAAHAADRAGFDAACRLIAERPVQIGPPLDEQGRTLFQAAYERAFLRPLHPLWAARDHTALGHCSPSEITPEGPRLRLACLGSRTSKPANAADGWMVLRDLWEPNLVDAVAAEAAAMRGSALLQDDAEYSVNAHGYLTSSRLQWYAYPGRLLRDLHESPDLLSFLRETTGLPLLPTRAAYVYYEPEGHIGLHTDIAQCSVTLFMPLHPADPPPLRVRPDLMGAAPERLLHAARHGGTKPSGVPVSYMKGTSVLIFGSRLPHGRPRVTAPMTLAALCYDRLLPQ